MSASEYFYFLLIHQSLERRQINFSKKAVFCKVDSSHLLEIIQPYWKQSPENKKTPGAIRELLLN